MRGVMNSAQAGVPVPLELLFAATWLLQLRRHFLSEIAAWHFLQ
jgi:hypothetical protein